MAIGRHPSIGETEDFATLAYAHENDGALPGWLSEYTRDALVTVGWVTPTGRLTEEGAENAARWVAIRQESDKGFQRGGRFTPLAPGGRRDDSREARADARYGVDPR